MLLGPRYFLLSFAALVGSGPAMAVQDPQGFSLTYDAYMSGLKALTLQFDLAVDAASDASTADYRAAVEIETSGLVSAFVGWRLEATSRGQLSDAGVQPEIHRTANFRGDKARRLTIDYGDDGTLAVRRQPSVEEDDREPVPVTEIAGTIDPMSALTQALMLAKDGSVCPPLIRIFDGRRRYDLKTEPLAEKIFTRSRVATYEGPALGCRITFEKIAGFKEPENSDDDLATIELWMSDLLGNGVWVPVRLAMERGRMMVHLKKAELADGTLVFGE